MLECDYTKQLEQVISAAQFKIELPEEMRAFFRDTGPLPTAAVDARRAARLRIRTKTVIFCEGHLPTLPRNEAAIGIYLADISRYGVGFITSEQYFPCEQVRVLLPTFWLSVTIVRANRLGPNCFHTGAMINKRHEPNAAAFEPDPSPLSVLVPA